VKHSKSVEEKILFRHGTRHWHSVRD